MTGVVMTFICCKPFSDARLPLICFLVVLFRTNNQMFRLKFATWSLLMFGVFSLNWFTEHLQKNQRKSFGQDWRKRLCIWGKMIGTLAERRNFAPSSKKDIKCYNRSECKILIGCIHCLYNNIIYRLYAATNQSVNDRTQPTLRVNTSHLALIQDPTVQWAYWLASIYGGNWRDQCACFAVQHLALVNFVQASCA